MAVVNLSDPNAALSQALLAQQQQAVAGPQPDIPGQVTPAVQAPQAVPGTVTDASGVTYIPDQSPSTGTTVAAVSPAGDDVAVSSTSADGTKSQTTEMIDPSIAARQKLLSAVQNPQPSSADPMSSPVNPQPSVGDDPMSTPNANPFPTNPNILGNPPPAISTPPSTSTNPPTPAAANPFDQFDPKPDSTPANPFDQFDAPTGDSSKWNIGKQAIDSATFGLAPKAQQFLQDHLPTSWVDQEGSADDMQKNADAWKDQHPYQAIAGDIAGQAPYFVAMPESIGGRLALNAALGGASGAGDAYAHGKDLSTIGEDAALGGTLGAGGGLVGEGLGAAGGKLVNALTGDTSKAAGIAGKQLGDDLPALTDEMSKQGVTSLADVSPNVKEFYQKEIAQNPAAASVIKGELGSRDDSFYSDRLNTVLNDNFGPDVNYTQKLNDLKSTTQDEGHQAYGDAWANEKPIDTDSVVRFTRAQAAPGGVLTDNSFSKSLNDIADDIENPDNNLRSLHTLQQQIQDNASSAGRAGNNNEARIWSQVRNGLLDSMEADNPAYQTARSNYADNKSIEEAFQNGRNIFKPTLDGQTYDPDLLTSKFENMTQPEKDAFQLGSRKALADTAASGRSDSASMISKFGNENGYPIQKLQVAFGDDPANALLNEVNAQKLMKATNSQVLGNSKTAVSQTPTNGFVKGTMSHLTDPQNITSALMGAWAGYEHGGLGGALAGGVGAPLAHAALGGVNDMLATGSKATQKTATEFLSNPQKLSDALARAASTNRRQSLGNRGASALGAALASHYGNN